MKYDFGNGDTFEIENITYCEKSGQVWIIFNSPRTTNRLRIIPLKGGNRTDGYCLDGLAMFSVIGGWCGNNDIKSAIIFGMDELQAKHPEIRYDFSDEQFGQGYIEFSRCAA